MIIRLFTESNPDDGGIDKYNKDIDRLVGKLSTMFRHTIKWHPEVFHRNENVEKFKGVVLLVHPMYLKATANSTGQKQVLRWLMMVARKVGMVVILVSPEFSSVNYQDKSIDVFGADVGIRGEDNLFILKKLLLGVQEK